MAEGRKSLRRPADALLVAVLCAAVSAAPQVVGGAEVFLDLTRPHAASARAIKASDIARGSVSYDGGEEDRWIVTNPYFPSDRNFFSMIYDAACAPDGTLLIADGYNNRVRTVNGSRLTDWLGMQGDRGEKDINGPARGATCGGREGCA